jgi:hypothetical protein
MNRYIGEDGIRKGFYKAVKAEVAKWQDDGADDIEGSISVSRIEGMIALAEALMNDEEEE